MKKIFYSIIVLTISVTVFAQAPQSFKYQAVVRDATGEVIANQTVGFQISILQSSASGTAVYTETHVDSTNQFGLVTLEIGSGTTTDDFSGINWSNDAYFIQIEMDASGGTSYTLMGTSQLLSMPYALHAKTAANIFSGNYSDLTGTPSNVSIFTNDAGYLTSIIETDPVYGASVTSGITETDTSNWNNKLDSYTETDPVFGTHAANGITSTNITNWTTAFGWGDHSTTGYLTSYTETDPVFGTHAANGITSTNITNWDAAYGWGDHSLEGYLTNYTETDPEVGTNTANYLSKWDGSALVSSSIFDNGNVGIGTTNPETSLDIGSKTDGIVMPKGITDERPSSPVIGTMRYNTTLGQPEYYDGTEWLSLAPPKGVGGIITEVGGYRIHTFLESGTFTAKVAMDVDVLVVAGGGSGGSYSTTNANGGGGGGGVIYQTDHAITPGEYPVTVGKGGGGIHNKMALRGKNGENSVFNTLTALGGGGGGATGSGAGLAGGSGGGGGYDYAGGAATQGGPGGFGNAGGAGNYSWTGGGGGGAGSAGVAGNVCGNCAPSGNGGTGYVSLISGTTRYYGGGGGGSGNSVERAGDGYDGGGRGFGTTSQYNYNEYFRGEINAITKGSATLDAVPNTGGGGGGNSYWSENVDIYGSGKGGSGIVIIRYLISQ